MTPPLAGVGGGLIILGDGRAPTEWQGELRLGRPPRRSRTAKRATARARPSRPHRPLSAIAMGRPPSTTRAMAGMRLSGGGDVLDSKPINVYVRTRALRDPILEGIRGVCMSGRWQAVGDGEGRPRRLHPGQHGGAARRRASGGKTSGGREGSQHGKLQEGPVLGRKKCQCT